MQENQPEPPNVQPPQDVKAPHVQAFLEAGGEYAKALVEQMVVRKVKGEAPIDVAALYCDFNIMREMLGVLIAAMPVNEVDLYNSMAHHIRKEAAAVRDQIVANRIIAAPARRK